MTSVEQTKSQDSGQMAPPSISLPKGGGAIRGIGEKFSANPVTGTASITVPIATSPGRSGFGPQLSLSYDSGAGNGPFGFGWSLSLPTITRKTDKGLPRYLDSEDSDTFILSGAEDLVPLLVQNNHGKWEREKLPTRTVNGFTYEICRYRPRIEGLFARIERWTNTIDASDVFWRSISKDNITTWYGKTPESRISDPANPSRIFSWLICQSHDDKGNVIVYGYKPEDSDRIFEDSHGNPLVRAHESNRTTLSRSAQRYLKRIRYSNRLPYFPILKADAPWPEPADTVTADGSNSWLFEVVFDYGEHNTKTPTPIETGKWPARRDPFSSYRAGFEVRTYRSCQRVLMFHHFPGEKDVERDCLVRSTDFTYSDEVDPADVRNPVYTFLLSVTQTGYRRNNGGYDSRSLPPVEFMYTDPNVQNKVEQVDQSSLDNLPVGLDGSSYRWTDLHGEGIPGILTEQAGAWFYKRNLSPISEEMPQGGELVKAKFAPLQTVALKPNVTLNGGAEFMDLAGDGQPDVVVMEGPTPGFYEHDDAEGWQSFRPFTSRLNLDTRDPNVKFVDLDGDGHADVLITNDDALIWHSSLAEEGFGPAQRISQALDEEKGPHIVFADGTQSIYLADLSGDGLTDIVRIRNCECCYWPNLGGHFGAKVTMDNAPCFDNPDQFDHKRIRLADIDGSGTTDIIYLHRDGARLYFNQSGNSWSQPYNLKVFPLIDDLVSVVPIDLLGNGTACLVWSSPLPGDACQPMRYVNLMGGQKPHLLFRTINNLGAETCVDYAPSTKFYLQDKRDGISWITRLPFPVHVVERVETYDHISRNRFVTRYAYHAGHFDAVEREFCGFGMVEQWDTEEFAALVGGNVPADNIAPESHVPPVRTKTWYHTGAYLDRDRISRQFEHEYFREPGTTDDEARELLLPDTIPPPGLSLEEEREACRALKGSMLRQEVYADDAGQCATPKQVQRARTPYTVTEQNFTIRTVQPRGGNRHSVFFTHTREAINHHYERNPADPRIQHSLTLEVDAFRNVLKQAAIGYGRRTQIRVVDEQGNVQQIANSGLSELDATDQAKQTTPLMTYTENLVTNAIDTPDTYRTPLPAESRTYELRKAQQEKSEGNLNKLFCFDDVLRHVRQSDDGGHDIDYEDIAFARAQKAVVDNPNEEDKYFHRLIEHTRTLYRRDKLDGLLPLGDLQAFALPGESYKLAFTPGLLAQVFQRPRPGQSTEPLLPDPAAVLGGQAGNCGAYVQSQIMKADGCFPDTDDDDHWWIPSGQSFFTTNPLDRATIELTQAQQHFFLPRRYHDPFGQDVFVDFDTNDLLMSETRDALGNCVTVDANDYRVLQPRLVSDPNRNQNEVAFDTLGMVTGTAIMGMTKQVEGDTLEGFVTDLIPTQLDQFMLAPRQTSANREESEPTQVVHDILKGATTRIVYDLDRFQLLGEPPFAATIARESHVSDMKEGQESKLQISFSYSDGFGREIQKKIQAEPGQLDVNDSQSLSVNPRWVGSGWTIFNNKGKPVRQFEPFFSATHAFEFAAIYGVGRVLCYDPAERVVATLHPNNTYEKVVFDPWQQTTYDVNDTCAPRNDQKGDPRTDPDIQGYVKGYFDNLPPSSPAHAWQTWYAQRVDGDRGAHEKAAANKAADHADTPTTAHFDALSRPFLTVMRNRVVCKDHALHGKPDEEFRTRVDLDIEGNQREVRDERRLPDANGLPLGELEQRVVMHYSYDMLGNRIHQLSMEAGARWMLNDVSGKPVCTWDSRGHNFTTVYDVLRRPIEQYVQGTFSNPDPLKPNSDPRTLVCQPILVDKIEYGEPPVNASHAELGRAIRLNLRTRIYRHFDSAGMAINARLNANGDPTEAYDFKGNLLYSTRRMAKSYQEIPDWSQDTEPQLEAEYFEGSTRYDALNRPIQSVAPHSSLERGKFNVIQPVFNEANLLERVDVWLERAAEPTVSLDPNNEAPSPAGVVNIEYTAKGQRQRIDYKNGVSTFYSYDPLTFLLTQLLTRRNAAAFPGDYPQPPITSWPGKQVQNLHYTYDPAGNITHIQDDAQQTIYFRNKRVEPSNDYVYDALYRLIQADGREHLGQLASGECKPPTAPDGFNAFHTRLDHPGNGQAMGTYTERYVYDAVGNLLQMQHRGSDPAHPGWTRAYDCLEPSLIEDGNGALLKSSNRLTRTMLNPAGNTAQPETYPHDSHGNMVRMPHLSDGQAWPNMHWDYKDRLRQIDLGDGAAYYVYDAAGQRVRKVWEKALSLTEERIFLGGFEIFRKHGGPIGENTAALERETLHVMDNKKRIALAETCTLDTAGDNQTRGQLIRCQLGNHLGSASLELDEQAQIISYEEYAPYGSSTYQAVRSQTETPKRYRYAGKERDEESGLSYHGARYYAPWLGRFTQCDPFGIRGGMNLYPYAAANPVCNIDPTGEAPQLAPQQQGQNPREKVPYDRLEREFHLKAAAFEAALVTQSVVSEHEALVQATGKGKYFGTKSHFAGDPTSDRSGLEELNCILYQLKPVEAYIRDLEASGELPKGTWDAVRKATEDSRGVRLTKKDKEILGSNVDVGRETVLMEQLRERAGFASVLVDRGEMVGKLTLSRAVEKAAGLYPPKADLVKGADSGGRIDVRTNIDITFKNTKMDRAEALKYLNTLPFAIVTEDFGYHTLVLSFGVIYEAHWAAEPTERDHGRSDPMFERTPLASYLKNHENLVFAVPPGYEPRRRR